MDDALATLLDRVAEVCPLPNTARKVLELAQSESAGMPELAKVIVTDPALATGVLRIANSAAYGGRNIDQLEQALLRIGLRELRDMAAAMSLLATFRSQAELALKLHDRSVVSGSIAHRMAKETGVAPPGTAFTAGLLCEIGAMACVAVDGKQYIQIWTDAAGDEAKRSELELARYGFTSLQVGERFLERNGLPANVSQAVGTPLDEQIGAREPLAKLLVLARHATNRVLASAATLPRAALEAELDTLCSAVGLAGIQGARMLELCVQAGVTAEQALRAGR